MVDYLVIDETARDFPVARRLLARFPSARVTFCEPGGRGAIDPGAPGHGVHLKRHIDPGAPRRAVYLKRHAGCFLKRFPSDPWYGEDGACHYSLILGYNCFCSCRYCFIQTIFDHAVPTLYADTDRMIGELRSFLSRTSDAWISTGEYLDSFQLDETTRYNELLMGVFRDYPAATLELRTKIDSVDHMPENPPRCVLVSYSINPPEIVRQVEQGTAGFDRRMAKAALLHAKGYRIALRVDPIIWTSAFSGGYSELPALVEEHLGWDRVEKVFLGALRFDADLLKRMSRSPAARQLLDAEYVPCPDGYYRPFKNARIDAYRMVVNAIRRYKPDIDFALTMEPEYVRNGVFSRAP